MEHQPMYYNVSILPHYTDFYMMDSYDIASQDVNGVSAQRNIISIKFDLIKFIKLIR